MTKYPRNTQKKKKKKQLEKAKTTNRILIDNDYQIIQL